jgi:hypothetical protein
MKIARATSEEATQAPSATEMKVMLVTHLQIGMAYNAPRIGAIQAFNGLINTLDQRTNIV